MTMEGGGVTKREEIQAEMSQNRYRLYGILIYSDADKNFIRFLTDAHDSLAAMSGAEMFLFWFEHFSEDSVLLWAAGKAPPRRSTLGRSESLRLAKAFDVPMSQTPCLLVCQDLDDKNSVVYSFNNLWSHELLAEHFKGIFDVIESVLGDVVECQQNDLYKKIEVGFKRLKIKKWVKRLVSNQSIGNLLRAIATGASISA